MQSLVVKEKDLILADSMKLDYLRIFPEVGIKAVSGKTVTMIMDGKTERIPPGEYEGDIELVVRDEITRPFEFDGGKEYVYRVGLYIKDNQLIPEKSVTESVSGGSITDEGIDKVSISGYDVDFNGIMVEGDSEYKISNVKIDFLGNGTNDFMGMGFGICLLYTSRCV